MEKTFPTTIRVSKETQKKMKILAAQHETSISNFYGKIIDHLTSLPEKQVEKLLK